jgi:hypothetical protein
MDGNAYLNDFLTFMIKSKLIINGTDQHVLFTASNSIKNSKTVEKLFQSIKIITGFRIPYDLSIIKNQNTLDYTNSNIKICLVKWANFLHEKYEKTQYIQNEYSFENFKQYLNEMQIKNYDELINDENNEIIFNKTQLSFKSNSTKNIKRGLLGQYTNTNINNEFIRYLVIWIDKIADMESIK